MMAAMGVLAMPALPVDTEDHTNVASWNEDGIKDWSFSFQTSKSSFYLDGDKDTLAIRVL
jgi:hypothetical protein